MLAGGASSRMGRDKALLPFGASCLLSQALGSLSALRLPTPPRIAGARTDLSAFAVVVPDLHPGCGPLSGIEAALAASSQPLNLLLAVDLPFMPFAFLRVLLQRASLTEALITVPYVTGRPQPLCAVYHRDLLPRVTTRISDGKYKASNLIEDDRLRSSVDRFDMELVTTTNPEISSLSPLPWREWFRNLNSPKDLAESLAVRERDRSARMAMDGSRRRYELI